MIGPLTVLGYRSVSPVKSMPTLAPACLRRGLTRLPGPLSTPSSGMLGRRKKGFQPTETGGAEGGRAAIALSRLRFPTQHQGHMLQDGEREICQLLGDQETTCVCTLLFNHLWMCVLFWDHAC